ncbi:DoxX family protein [Mucilaginibacter sp. HMF5004]|uniref:DoxX family protein n=1 Tax=Mucilaginibacter rivuli TaxID=2857527 RepID=UPI001C5E251C|nr:DoxX family protein [Mucilaginibacter rivuli]MBW4891794.1 DoxX family protein [Mucilaginibacter rivuli]
MTTSNKTIKKSDKIIYWVSTSILALFILPGIFFLNSPMAKEGTGHLGLPNWFAMEAGIGSFIGGLILIIPMWKRLKEWAYVALGIVYLSALIAHLSVDGVQPGSFAPLITFGILLVSYIYYHKITD